MKEHDAHLALTATARMRALAEPVEDAQLMTFSERMYRAREARLMHGNLDMYYRPLYSPERHKPWPAADFATIESRVNAQIIAEGRKQREIDAHIDHVYFTTPGHTKITEAQHHSRMQRDGFSGDDTQ